MLTLTKAHRVVDAKIERLRECDLIEAYATDIRMSLTIASLNEYLNKEISWRRASVEDKAKVQFQVFTFVSAAMFLGTPFILASKMLLVHMFILFMVSVSFGYLLTGIILAIKAFRTSAVALLSLEEQTEDEDGQKRSLLQAIDLNEEYTRQKINLSDVSSSCIRNGLVVFAIAFFVSLLT